MAKAVSRKAHDEASGLQALIKRVSMVSDMPYVMAALLCHMTTEGVGAPVTGKLLMISTSCQEILDNDPARTNRVWY
jgi:hypothetical protein